MIQVIKIDDAFAGILPFLYPDYSIGKASSNKFIIRRDIKSIQERSTISYYFSDGVIISNLIFDEIWDKPRIEEECIKYARSLGSRKRKFDLDVDNPIQSAVNFIFNLPSYEEDSNILDLFNSFGSDLFISSFITTSKVLPLSVVNQSMLTFLTKVIQGTSSIFYRKKHSLYGDVVSYRVQSIIPDFSSRLSSLNYFYSLFK